MEKYIYLSDWTDQGVQDASNSIHRASEAVDTMEAVGARIYEVYWTTGPYDLVFMAEVPDAETAQAITLALSRGGNVRTHAMRAFDRSEMLRIVSSFEELEPGSGA